MSWSVVIHCDKDVAFHEGRPIGVCRATFRSSSADGDRARLAAADAGWLLGGGQDLCPDHNPLRFHPLARHAGKPQPDRPAPPPEGGRVTPLRPTPTDGTV